MNINFTPISMFGSYSLAVAGDSVVIDGKTHALSDLISAVDNEHPMPEFVVSASADGITLLLPYWGVDAPEVSSITVEDGPVELPV